MKPLIVLLLSFAITLAGTRIFGARFDFSLAARLGMCAMLFFTAIGHFVFIKGMSMMIPGFIPFRTQLVVITGMLEVLLGLGLLITGFKVLSGWLLIVFFVILLPANINAAIKRIDYQKGTFDGNGPDYLWFRVPLQLLFIAWTYVSAIMY